MGAYLGLVWYSPSRRPNTACPGRGPGGRVADTQHGWHLLRRRVSARPAGTASRCAEHERPGKACRAISLQSHSACHVEVKDSRARLSGDFSSHSHLPSNSQLWHSSKHHAAVRAASRVPGWISLKSCSEMAGSEEAGFWPSLNSGIRQTTPQMGEGHNSIVTASYLRNSGGLGASSEQCHSRGYCRYKAGGKLFSLLIPQPPA